MKQVIEGKNLYYFLLFSVIIVCLIQSSRIQEGLEDYNKVVLLGDSIFKNNSYVGEENSIEYLLKTRIDSLVLAKDNSLIKDVLSQYKNVPNKYNEPNTYLFVSTGGNDLLNGYHYSNGDITNMKKFNEIWKQYEKTILQLKNKTDCTLVLSDLYYIKDQDYLKYHKIIKKWNDVLYEFCDKNNILIYKISSFVKDKKHFVNSIEPSKIGSKLIVDNIIKF